MDFKKEILVGNKIIGGTNTFIIAEIGSNHNQSIELAYELIDEAVNAGADAVKFQSINPEKIYNLSELENDKKELLEKIQLREDWYEKLYNYCKSRDIIFFSAPTYLEAISMLVASGVKIMKIASPQTYGYPKIIQEVGLTGLPTLMSTGYCNYSEIERAIRVFKSTRNDNLILLHCISNYPTQPIEVNLNFINTLEKMFGTIVGFSDHTLGYHIALSAVAKGAKVIEKHLTLSRSMEGPDHFFALEPKEFREMVYQIKDIELAMGSYSKTDLVDFEIDFRNEVEMKLVAGKELEEGEEISSDKIIYLRERNIKGISAWCEKDIIGKRTGRSIPKGTFLEYKDFL